MNQNEELNLAKEELEIFKQIGDEAYQNRNTNVNGNINGSYKRTVNIASTRLKHEVISLLSLCNYRTPRKVLADLLEALFQDPETHDGHWLYVAQNWNPRAINRVIEYMSKAHRLKAINKSPAAYFTFLIQHRRKRRATSTNGTYKRHRVR